MTLYKFIHNNIHIMTDKSLHTQTHTHNSKASTIFHDNGITSNTFLLSLLDHSHFSFTV